MKLVTYSKGDEKRIGFILGTNLCDLAAAAKATQVTLDCTSGMMALARVENLPALRKILAAVGNSPIDASTFALEQVTLHAPYRPRQNITIAGGNTRDDFVAERTRKGHPMLRYHTKAPSATVDPGQAISWPRQLTSQVHAEPNVAVVMGALTFYADAASVLDNVFGFAVATNVISSDLKRKHGQWDKAVSLDTFFPWGPVIATADEVELESLACRLWLNDRMALSGGAESGLLGTAAILAEISFGMTLKPGDVVLTSTAEGIGFGESPERWLQDGDVIRSAIEGIGEIENSVACY